MGTLVNLDIWEDEEQEGYCRLVFGHDAARCGRKVTAGQISGSYGGRRVSYLESQQSEFRRVRKAGLSGSPRHAVRGSRGKSLWARTFWPTNPFVC